MNDDLRAATKFFNIAGIMFFVFLAVSVIGIPILSYIFKNYWLLFGILFSFIGYFLYNNKPSNLFFTLTFAIVIYWIFYGFKFSEPITFFWFSYFIANIFKGFYLNFEKLGNDITNNNFRIK